MLTKEQFQAFAKSYNIFATLVVLGNVILFPLLLFAILQMFIVDYRSGSKVSHWICALFLISAILMVLLCIWGFPGLGVPLVVGLLILFLAEMLTFSEICTQYHLKRCVWITEKNIENGIFADSESIPSNIGESKSNKFVLGCSAFLLVVFLLWGLPLIYEPILILKNLSQEDVSSRSKLPDTSLTKLHKKAQDGDWDAQFELGKLYIEDKESLDYNPEEAVKWLTKASEAGNVEATGLLGGCYFEGLGIEKDASKGIELFRIAAEGGDAISQYVFGVWLLQQNRGPFSENVAISWIKKSAYQGYEPAVQYLQSINDIQE